MLVVIGTSPFNDTSVAVLARTEKTAQDAVIELESKGWNTEVVPTSRAAEIPNVTNEED